MSGVSCTRVSNGDIFDIPAWEITKAERTTSDLQVKKWVGVVSVVFKPGHRKTFEEAADAISSVLDDSGHFQIWLKIFHLRS